MIFCRKNTLRSRKSQTKSIQMKFVVFLMWSTTKNRPNIRAHAIPVTTQTTVNAIKCVSCTIFRLFTIQKLSNFFNSPVCLLLQRSVNECFFNVIVFDELDKWRFFQNILVFVRYLGVQCAFFVFNRCRCRLLDDRITFTLR